MTEEEIGHIFTIAKKLSLSIIKNLKAKGTNIFVANGAIAGQKAPHMMVHIIPRTDGDGINLVPSKIEVSPEKLEETRQKLLRKVKETFRLNDEQMTKLGMMQEQPDHQKQPDKPEQVDVPKEEKPEEEFDFDALNETLKNGM